MKNNLSMIIFFIYIITIFYQYGLTENECILKALKKADQTNLYFTDYLYIKTALLNYRLMPDKLAEAIRNCNINLENSIKECEKVYGYKNCELCGMVAMEKCKENEGYKRFSCGSCYKECSKETIIESKGLLCRKPKIYKRPIYDNFEECQIQNINCINNDDMIVPICKENYEQLGNNLCLYKCEDGFKNLGEFCKAPFYTQSDYYMREFVDEINITDS